MRKYALALAAVVALAVPSPAAAQGIDLTCQFGLTRLDSTTTNVLALDTNAIYWGTTYAATPGARIRIEGQYPYSRYMSWNVYDTTGRPFDAAADFRIRPAAGSRNPFAPGASRLATRRDYTLFIEFGPRPPQPAPKTLYTGDSRAGVILYRVYIPDAGRDAKGGVPLPKVTLEPSAGAPLPGGPSACREAQAPYLEPVNELIRAAPGLPDPTDDGEGYPGRNPPNWRLFTNLQDSATDILFDNETGEDYYEQARSFRRDGPGFFSNLDISYVFTGTSRGHGEVLVLRGRGPSFADTRSGRKQMPAATHLRYWSLCQYEPSTQRVIDCLSDDRVALDASERYTVVVSTPENRPANARPECRVSWLAWGPQTQGLLIYRHMLAHRTFEHAIQRIPEPGAERVTMREYYPGGEYLADAAAFERRGCPAR